MGGSMAATELATEVEETKELVENAAFEVGQLLKRARQDLKLSIGSVAAEIRIRQQYLESIECGNLSDLPGQVYVVGFIKTYATFLKLDYEELLRRLNLEKEVFFDYSSFNYAIPTTQQQYPSKVLVITASLLAATLLCVIYFLTNQDEAEVASGVQGVVNSDSIAQEEYTSVTAQDNLLASVDASSVTEQETNETKDQVVKISEPIQSSDSAPVASVAPTSRTNQIQLIATQDAWVQVLDQTGKTIYVRLMHPGDSYTLPTELVGCTLNTGNAGGVKVRVGDKESAVLGVTGKIIRGLALTNDNLTPLLNNSSQSEE